MRYTGTFRALALLLAVLPACDFNPAGLRLGISVDRLAAAGVIQANQHMRLAAWVGQKPSDGDRPASIFHKAEHEDLSLDNRDPTELCLPDLIDPTIFDCTTHLLVNKGETLWVGAFFEYFGAADGVPDPGEILTVTGPFVVLGPQASINDILITVVNPDVVDIESPETLLETLGAALEDNDGAALELMIHPFFSSNWNLDFDQFAEWLAGSFSDNGVTFDSPLSTPLAGIMSATVRDELDLKSITVTQVDLNINVAKLDVDFSLREDPLQAPFDITERWVVETSVAIDRLAISRIDVDSRSIDGIKIAAVTYDEGQVIADWTGSVEPDQLQIGIDTFDPETRTWSTPATDTVIEGKFTRCLFGKNMACSNPAPVSTPSDQFYRVRVTPINSAVSGRTSYGYLAGPTYLP